MDKNVIVSHEIDVFNELIYFVTSAVCITSAISALLLD